MFLTSPDDIIRQFRDFVTAKAFPCVAARAAMARNNISCLVVNHMECPADDERILQFIYSFIDQFRKKEKSLQSVAIIFERPEITTDESFDELLWQRLQALNRLDAINFSYDTRVSADPSDANFSYSLGQEAFFIIGLHPGSNRRSRRFRYPTMIFNPHVQFQELRQSNTYEKMKTIVRHRDKLYSGSVNPMLHDFGEVSEVFQYSGRQYDGDWRCPLKVAHDKPENNTPTQ